MSGASWLAKRPHLNNLTQTVGVHLLLTIASKRDQMRRCLSAIYFARFGWARSGMSIRSVSKRGVQSCFSCWVSEAKLKREKKKTKKSPLNSNEKRGRSWFSLRIGESRRCPSTEDTDARRLSGSCCFPSPFRSPDRPAHPSGCQRRLGQRVSR